MRPRVRRAAEVLPPELASGPDPRQWGGSDREARVAWHEAGRAWSVANGHSANGWLNLLSPPVRRAVTARTRRDRSFVPPWRASL